MAPIYTFTGEGPAVLVGLIQGVNAYHVAAPGNLEVPEGSTIVAAPGEVVDTGDLLYPAYVLHDEATGASSVAPDEAPELVAAPLPAEQDDPAVDAPPTDSAPADADTAPAPTF